MKCQIKNCNNECTRVSSSHGIFSGVNLDHICIHTCDKHSITEINKHLSEMGKSEADKMLLCNPFEALMINENHD